MGEKHTCYVVCDSDIDDMGGEYTTPIAVFTERWRADLMCTQTGFFVCECELYEGNGSVRDD